MIKVTLLDVRDGEAFAETLVSESALPDELALGSMLEIDGVRWEVRHAEPSKRSDIERGGEVSVVLGQMVTGNAPVRTPGMSDVKRYEVATVSGHMPELLDAEEAQEVDVLILPEELWRQFEIIADELGDEVDAEIEDIQQVFLDEDFGERVHERTRLAAPMQPFGLTLERFAGEIAPSSELLALGYGQQGVVRGGFALQSERGTIFYGVTDEAGVIEILGIAGWARDQRSVQGDVEQLQDDILSVDQLIMLPWTTIHPE